MQRYAGKVAIVTGASAGIGEAIVDSLTKAGMLVVGLARRVERVQTLAQKLSKESAKGKLHAVQCDMRVEDDIVKAFEWTTKNVGNVQVLVNNAGVISQSNLSEGATEDWRKILETNVLGLCVATREATKNMKANKTEGHIIHINSITGISHIYFPTAGVYGASKHAVTNITEIFRQEMVAQKTNIKVSSISPGAVRTEIHDAAGGMNEAMVERLSKMPPLECEDIADAVIYVLGVPQRVQINELTIRPLNSPH
ncbi:farnesol dehydrogenase-like [Atheta coriaria]|uniref:farnesol dehydrogenase-like n=1 Tax=Dalotia coriaria TaxID=877792 RepID=UPI0031F444EE